MRSLSLLCFGEFLIHVPCEGVILPLHLPYICASMDIFLHHITVSEFIYMCMLYNLIVGCTSSLVFCIISLLFTFCYIIKS